MYKLIERVGALVAMSPEEIMERGEERRKGAARSILCYWATDRWRISQREVATRFNLTQPIKGSGLFLTLVRQ